MKKLLKTYDLNSDMQYFEMIVESFINGQLVQACDQFKAMPKDYKILFLKNATIGGWDSGLSNSQISRLFEII